MPISTPPGHVRCIPASPGKLMFSTSRLYTACTQRESKLDNELPVNISPHVATLHHILDATAHIVRFR